jgi:serine/threonine protein kinase
MGDAGTANVRSCRDDFTFLEDIGCGSFGGVNLARRSKDGLLYAIKTVKLDMLTRKDQLAAVSEAQARPGWSFKRGSSVCCRHCGWSRRLC